MTTTAAPARPGAIIPDRLVRRVELIGLWAVDCVKAHRPQTDWSAELLADPDHHHQAARLDQDGYRLDRMQVQTVSHQAGTAYVRLIMAVSIRPARILAAGRGLRTTVDDLLLAPARARATAGRLIDAAIVPAR